MEGTYITANAAVGPAGAFSPVYGRETQFAIVAAHSAGAIVRESFIKGEAGQTDRRAEQQVYDILTRAFPTYGYRGEESGLLREAADPEKHHWLIDPQDGASAASQGFRGAAVSIALLRAGCPVLGVVYAYAAPGNSGDLFFWAQGMPSLQRNTNGITNGVTRKWPTHLDSTCTALISPDADLASDVHAEILKPMRYRSVPAIAYRLALVAAGEGDLAVSLNEPMGWNMAGGHALLLGAGAELLNQLGEPVRYDDTGHPLQTVSRCFGGPQKIVREYIVRPWSTLFQEGRQEPVRASLSSLIPGQLVSDAALLSRAQGCLLGQLAGDALGSLVEFQTAQDIARQFPHGPSELADGGYWATLAGQPTDDSELALALARSIIDAGAYDPEQAARAYAKWMASNPFDCGKTTSAALFPAVAALQSHASVSQAASASANSKSQANEALMRISPLAIFGASLDPSLLMSLAREDAKLTHPNPICQDANAIFSAALAFAIQTGATPEETYRRALELAQASQIAEPVIERLQAAFTAPPAEFAGPKMGWVLVAFQNAFFRLLHSPSMQDGIVETVRAGGDTDTNAAIAGALLGAVYGRENVPPQWTARLLTCRPISGLTGVKKPRPSCYWPVDALTLAERLLLLKPSRKRERP